MSFWSDKNVGRIERWLSGVAAAGVITSGLRRGTLPALGLAAVGGGWLIVRGVTGHCPVYRMLGIDRSGKRRIGTHDGSRRMQASEERGQGREAMRGEAMIEEAQIESERPLDVVQEASEESFPASDAPGWTRGAGPG